MNSVKILNIDQITPLAGPFSSPGEIVPLSFFDTLWFTMPAVQFLFLYPDYSNANVPMLKFSLSKTLLNFYSLSGRISYIPSTMDIIIDCRREINRGVTFIEAECDNLSIEVLANDPIHNMDAFEKLVPSIDAELLPASTLKVQLTKFLSGGLAMGITFHHLAADGKGIWKFIEAWSRSCRGDKEVGNEVGFIIDRALVNYRSGSEVVTRRFVKERRPGFPTTNNMSTPVQSHPQLIRRTLYISTAAVERIKEDIMNKATNGNSFTTPPSNFVVLTSLIWICFAKAKGISYEGISSIGIPLDARSYLQPPIPENYTGDCLTPLYAKLKGSKLHSEKGLVDACKEIIRSLNGGINDPLKGHEEWVKEMMGNPVDIGLIGAPSFKGYDLADFGWGRPERVEVVSISNDGCVNYLGGKEEGQIQLSIVLSSLCMDKFVEEFSKILDVAKLSSAILSRI